MPRDKVIVLDAGMGKTLSMKGVEIPPTIWSANALIVAPDVVVEIHRENIEAGAQIITTNSYGVILSDLAKEGLEDQYELLNEVSGQLAEQAVSDSGKQVMIAGSLPPQNGSYRPDRVLARETIEPLYSRQAELLAPYVDLFICETMSSIDEALAAISAVSDFNIPVMVGLSLHDEKASCLRSEESLEDAIRKIADLEPAGVLANCCLPERISDAMPIIVEGGFKYCGGYANAFTHVPQDWLLDGTKSSDGSLCLREDLSPESYQEFVGNWIDQGANIVGGCCGTTAAHTKAISEYLECNSLQKNSFL